LGLYARDTSLKGNVSLAKARWNDQVDLIKTGAGESGEYRFDGDIIDVKADLVDRWRRTVEGLSGRDGGIGRPKPDTVEFHGVACLRGHRGIAKRIPGRAEDIVGSSTVGSRTVRPENDPSHMSRLKQVERRRKLAQSHDRRCGAGGSGHYYGYRASRRVVGRLQVDLPGTDKLEIRSFTVDLHLGPAQRSGKVAVPDVGSAGEVVAENRYPLAWLDDAYRAAKRNHAAGRNGRGLDLARASGFRARGIEELRSGILPGHG
jgi:hypothetical protein